MFRIENISYLYLLMGVVFMVIFFYGLIIWKKKLLRRLVDERLIKGLAPGLSYTRQWIKFAFLVLCFICFIIGLANPQFGGRKQKVKAKSSDVFIALDISNSMLAEDISPSRLEKSKRFAAKLIQNLKGERIGLILFAGNAYLQMPLTKDYAASELFVSTANPDQAGTQGTSFAGAIDLAMDAFEPDSDAQKALIIISDGEDHEDEALSSASTAKDQGIVIYTIAAGTAEGGYIPISNRGREQYKTDENGEPVISTVNLQIMADIADETGGKFYTIDDEIAVINDLKQQVERLQKKEVEQESFTDFTSYFQYFIGLGLLFLVIEYLFSEHRKIKSKDEGGSS